MSERYTLEQFERDKAKREEEARKESEQQQERVTKANQKRLWTSDGDTESSFEAAWPCPRPLSIYSTYNTKGRFFSAVPHPKAGRGYGEV